MRLRFLVISWANAAGSVSTFLARSSDSTSSDDGGGDGGTPTGACPPEGLVPVTPPGDGGTGVETGTGAGDGDSDSDADPGLLTLSFDPSGTGSSDAICRDDAEQVHDRVAVIVGTTT